MSLVFIKMILPSRFFSRIVHAFKIRLCSENRRMPSEFKGENKHVGHLAGEEGGAQVRPGWKLKPGALAECAVPRASLPFPAFPLPPT